MPDSNDNPNARKHSKLIADQLLLDDRTAVVALKGDLDLWSAPHLKGVLYDLVAGGRTHLVLDLEGVGFMDSTALGVLVGVHHRLGDKQRMAIAAAMPAVLRIFEMSGLASVFRVFATREAAVSFVTEDAQRASDRATPPLTADAALMLGIASTAMPFARSAEDQAERWLRALRNHGESGAVLASMGLSEGTLEEAEDGHPDEVSAPGDPDAVATVTRAASQIAVERGSPKLGTTDVLQAVIDVYGAIFYRVLSAHGVDPAVLKARMSSAEPAPAES
ncbi:MAG: anti-sigma factor antagonist [Candidatus Woesearchaeota archaeon]